MLFIFENSNFATKVQHKSCVVITIELYKITAFIIAILTAD